MYEVQINANYGPDVSFACESIAEVNAILGEYSAATTFNGAIGDVIDLADGGYAVICGANSALDALEAEWGIA